MKFEYTGRHIDVTPTLRAHVESHFDKINHLFDGNDNSKAHVIIDVEKGRHRAEIIVYWHKEVLTATTTEADMYQSLTRTIDKIEKQVLKLKNKITDKHHRAKKVTVVAAAPDTDVAPAPDSPQIIETNNYPVKPMTAEEAVLRLNDEENQFLVFRNADSDRISVIYKKQNGNYGLIQP
jgi:putative sigma-54 modulation protein